MSRFTVDTAPPQTGVVCLAACHSAATPNVLAAQLTSNASSGNLASIVDSVTRPSVGVMATASSAPPDDASAWFGSASRDALGKKHTGECAMSDQAAVPQAPIIAIVMGSFYARLRVAAANN